MSDLLGASHEVLDSPAVCIAQLVGSYLCQCSTCCDNPGSSRGGLARSLLGSWTYWSHAYPGQLHLLHEALGRQISLSDPDRQIPLLVDLVNTSRLTMPQALAVLARIDSLAEVAS